MAAELTDSFSRRLTLDYILVAAIDFGTTFSGYAFSFKSNKDDIRMFSRWGNCVGIAQSFKTPTCVLTKSDGTFDSFGYEAQNKYSSMDEDEIKDHAYYERFKMLLHNQTNLSRSTYVTARGGQRRPALDIFGMCLRFLKNHMLGTIKDQTESMPGDDHIRWVITVPAIWSDAAKQFMREAAKWAGIIQSTDSKRLVIALEPEAASLYCRQLDFNHFLGSVRDDTTMRAGTKYLVLDCGGGTMDITAHHLLKEGTVEELYRANGGHLGGTRVDENFVELLRNVFGGQVITQYQRKCPSDWLQMMSTFERMKRGLAATNVATSNIPISFEFSEVYQDISKKSIKKAIKEEHKRKGITFASGMLRIPHDIMLQLFVPISDAIVKHVADLFKKPEIRNISHLLLVGGFGESPVLQDAIKSAFQGRLKILIPGEASLCVVKGAVAFGHNPETIVLRRARRTYGTDIYPEFNREIHNPNKTKDYGGKLRAEGIFDTWLRKDSEIEVGQAKTYNYVPNTATQSGISVGIYATERDDYQYVDDPGVEHIGGIRVALPGTGLDRKVEVKIKFGGTEIQVEAKDPRPGGEVRETTVNFLND